MAISTYELHGERQLYSYYGASMFIILSLGLVGNTLTVLVFFHPHHRNKSMTSLMVNLSVADLLVCLLGYTVAVNYNTADFANTGEKPAVCVWLAIINCVTGLAAIATLTIMAVVSYLGIARTEIAQQNRMSRKVEALLISELFTIFMLVSVLILQIYAKENGSCCFKPRHRQALIEYLFFQGTWIYAIALTIPPALGWNRFIPIPSRISCHPDWYSPKLPDKAYIIYLLLFGFFVPFVIIIISYGGIYRHIKNTSVPQGADDHGVARHLRNRKKTLRVVVAMTLAYFFSWSPYAISSLVGSALGHESVTPAYSMVPELMAKASVIYNPILYALLNTKFRITLLNLCTCSWNRVGNGNTEDLDMGLETTTGANVTVRTPNPYPSPHQD